MLIEIHINQKIASVDQDYTLVGGNSYEFSFVFDDEWSGYDLKTARFKFISNGKKTVIDVILEDNKCILTIPNNTQGIELGVYAGESSTSTPYFMSVCPDIFDKNETPTEPEEDIYRQLLEKCNDAVSAANDVVKRADNGEFKGEKGENGNDYVLTDADKTEIAEIATANIDTALDRIIDIQNSLIGGDSV